MPRLTRIYTRTGDDGTTSLGSGRRIAKDALRIEAYGTVDELNSVLGLVVAGEVTERVRTPLTGIQNDLFHLGADLCILEEEKPENRGPTIEERHVDALEDLMDELNEELDPLENFVLPGGSPSAARLHLGRTVCRRAERLVVTLAREEEVGEHVLPYLNRLSDALFVMARHENRARDVEDVIWDSRA
ncbi:MAG: cob(I)yrinic acid a,c-diamide adenosyltransferase [Thermoanaerobaculia bacterium]|nr:cob(I)yrinic acid a,c-diamide adenosyltransferase [Thermoanaerobaculia bacterium]